MMRSVLPRLRATARRTRQVLGINWRNLRYIYPHNPRIHFPLADDKLRTKAVLADRGIALPETYAVYGSFYELRDLERDLAGRDSFVVKPAHGRAGGGVLVVTGRAGAGWAGAGGQRLSLAALKQHISDIVFGIYSFDMEDQAMVEERLTLHPAVAAISPFGLADLRVIVFRDRPVQAMLRVPTRDSGGRANLHQGAVGVGVDLERGCTVHAIHHGFPVTQHPDTEVPLLGVPLPDVPEVLSVCRRLGEATPLKYVGADIALTPRGPVLLEINARPGLEIQNANRTGQRALLESIL